jgi:hypothetical protein
MPYATTMLDLFHLCEIEEKTPFVQPPIRKMKIVRSPVPVIP